MSMGPMQHYAKAEDYVDRAEKLEMVEENVEVHTLLAFADLHLRLATAHRSVFPYATDEDEDLRP
jgi:hypothetical protein